MTKLQKLVQQQNSEVASELKKTEQAVNTKLESTVKKIDETVSTAQSEIAAEVVEVRKRVDEYKDSTQDQFALENNFMLYQLAGTFTLIGGLISMWHVTSHLRNFHNPVVQRKILAILWMAPIYSTTSWFSLVFTGAESYLSIVKDCYEAYVVYVFLSFLISVMGNGDRDTVVEKLALRADHLRPPCGCCGWFFKRARVSNKTKASAVLFQCQLFALQFVLFKPILAACNFCVHHLHMWGGGAKLPWNDWHNPRLYILGQLCVAAGFAHELREK